MADHTAPKLDHENHLLLEQPLLRLPYELLRKNLRLAHYEVEKEGTHIKNTLKDTATGCVNGRATQQDVLNSLDSMIARMRGVKRKLVAFSEEEQRLHRHEEARVHHLAELYNIHSVEDVKYDVWSRTRLDRLLVDYLLRHGHNDSARALAEEKHIELLADVETFEQMSRIRKSLLNRNVSEALAWCTAGDTKKELRKINVSLWRAPAIITLLALVLTDTCPRRRAISNSCSDTNNTSNSSETDHAPGPATPSTTPGNTSCHTKTLTAKKSSEPVACWP